jgi:hypothetical protein
MSHDNPYLSNDESEEDWLQESKQRMRSMQSKEVLLAMDTPSEVSVCVSVPMYLRSQGPSLDFSELDDTPLIPSEEVKACSILNPSCDSCQ